MLRGDYKQFEYQRVILPMVLLQCLPMVLRQCLDCVLEPTKAKALAKTMVS